MKRKFTESQIVAAIKKQESGIAVKEICRELSISDATFYNWKAKYGGLEVSEAKRAASCPSRSGWHERNCVRGYHDQRG